MTLADKFEYGTWQIRKNARETMTRVGYKHGHLALLRTDFLCPTCDETHEAWSVCNLVSGAYPFPGAVFSNIDDGFEYIYAITPLAKWDEANINDIRKLIEPLIHLCVKHNGIPTRVLAMIEDLIGNKAPGVKAPGIQPGTCAGLNGYTKQ